ncbi:hypothetical protein CN395_25060 [Priestia megaterium]|uniref:hypothetical protein n=1 Tax=Priestia megaterium TaxID=1404 RepID=UPI000BF4069E|nr:hypothetical protein [Priestia megaterium]PEU54962.1 hypothetical protein CN395_25060 [Priestia megaterium]
MAKKQQKNFTVDSKTAKEFQAYCKVNGVHESHIVEEFMESYISNNQIKYYDDIQAPRINELVSRTIQKEIERVIKLNRVLERYIKAAIAGIAVSHSHQLEALENVIQSVLREELLDPERGTEENPLPSELFDMTSREGQQMIGESYALAAHIEQKEKEQRQKGR